MKLVLFDVDGTLVDSQHHIVEAQRRTFAAHGLPPPTRERSLSVVGLSLPEAFAALLGVEAPVALLAESYKAAWSSLRGEPGFVEALYPGAADLLAKLAATPGVVLGLATGKSRKGVDRLVETFRWEGLFATVQTADDHPSKPDPTMLHAALRETGCNRGDAAFVGDTSFDMAMARAAGVRGIGVAWGYHAVEMLRRAGATSIVHDFTQLGDELDRAPFG